MQREVPHVGYNNSCAEPCTAVRSNKQCNPQQPIWHVLNSLSNSEPNEAKTREACKSTTTEHHPRMELVTDNSWQNAGILPNVSGHPQNGNLLLTETKHRLQRRREQWECIRIS
uniref:Uncharacterized protein n=1 Tax=Opuntia streptacantha TaxID=393608 RepID=A0A7C9FQY7_OPUST